MSEFNRGDTVKLKSGSPSMTVCEVVKIPSNGNTEIIITCKWFDKELNGFKRDDFYIEELDLCNN